MLGLFKKSKPVKIRSLNDNRKYGVAAKDVKELLKKGCKLLQVCEARLLSSCFFTSKSYRPGLSLLGGYGKKSTRHKQKKDTLALYYRRQLF